MTMAEMFFDDYSHVPVTGNGSDPTQDMPELTMFRSAAVHAINAHTKRDRDLLRHAADGMLRHATPGTQQSPFTVVPDADTPFGPVQAYALLAFAECDAWPDTAGGWADFCDQALDRFDAVRVLVALTHPAHTQHADAAAQVITDLRDTVGALTRTGFLNASSPTRTITSLIRVGAVYDAAQITKAVLADHPDSSVATHTVSTTDRSLGIPGLGATVSEMFVDDDTDDHYLLTTSARQLRLAGKPGTAVGYGIRALRQHPGKPWYAANALAAAARDANLPDLEQRAWDLAAWSDPDEEYRGEVPQVVQDAPVGRRVTAFIDWVLPG